MGDSILGTTKKLLGIPDSDEHFDVDIITHINSVFIILHQLGCGDKPFSITGKSETWPQFESDESTLVSVRTYMYLKVRMLFDPPTNSFTQEAFRRQIDELEWRLNTWADQEVDKNV